MTVTYHKLLTTTKAVDYLRIQFGYTTTQSTLETLRCRGGGAPFVKIRGRVYYREPDLDQWIHDNSIECVNTASYQTLAGSP